jgi:hypothetical protein
LVVVPVEALLGFGAVAEEEVYFSGAVVARIDDDKLTVVEADVTEGDFEEGARSRSRRAGLAGA